MQLAPATRATAEASAVAAVVDSTEFGIDGIARPIEPAARSPAYSVSGARSTSAIVEPCSVSSLSNGCSHLRQTEARGGNSEYHDRDEADDCGDP